MTAAKAGPAHFLADGPGDGAAAILLAHGAGAPMDTPWMNAVATALAGRGLSVIRFEFDYMAARRSGGTRKPPPRAETLMAEFTGAIAALEGRMPLIIGGKSMGGRVASMIADRCREAGQVSGLVCLGYPFHPPGKPASLRTAHLEGLQTPALICQGTRDPFGTVEEVAAYPLPDAIRFHWLEDGDHDFKPRKASGHTLASHIESVADAVAGFAQTLG
ncbi:alpha/beta family hydrolase [Zhengella sp. ZM62]|uniref:alpha/beta family hydrolase n=1 Tax=Zhengella sedimenti TaxID=3390035 RepID=UPI0039756000